MLNRSYIVTTLPAPYKRHVFHNNPGPEEFDVLYDPAPQCDRFSSGNENQKRCFRSPASRNRDLSAAEYISDAWLRSRGVVGKDAQKWRAEFVEQRCNTVSHANPMTVRTSHSIHRTFACSLQASSGGRTNSRCTIWRPGCRLYFGSR